MFLLFFLVFTLIFTIFENILVAGISLLFVCIIVLIYKLISKKEMRGRKLFFSIIGGFFLAGIAFGIKEWRYYGQVEEGQTTIIGTGIISDISNQGKYIFTYGNDEYLLYSKKEYILGDQIWIVGRMQENIQKDGYSYRMISSGTFAVPLFSGSFDFIKRMKMKGRKGTIYEDNSILVDGIDRIDGIGPNPSNPSQSVGFIKQMKKGIQEKVIKIYGENKVSGLLLGMLIGDKSQIPEMEYQQFIDSGLVHLIAVSGGNILMIVVFLQCILFFLPFYVRLGLILLTIVGYSLICGLDSSVFRAVLMGGLNMVALFWGREINIRRLLSMSCIIMLIINPYFLAYDTGFLLSYSALIGIVYFETMKHKNNETTKKENMDSGRNFLAPEGRDRVERRRNDGRVGRGLQYVYKNYISPSIGASIGIFPIIIFFMGKINLLGIIGNLFVLPIVPFVMIYGFVSIRLYSRLSWGRLLRVEQLLIQYIYKISELLANYGLYLSVSGLWIKYVILTIFLMLFVRRRIKDQSRDEKHAKS